MVNTDVSLIHSTLKHNTQSCDMAWLGPGGHCCMNGGGSRAPELSCSSNTAITVTVPSSTWQEAAWAKRHLSGAAASKECTGQRGWKQGRRAGCWDLSFSEAVTCLASSAAHASKASSHPYLITFSFLLCCKRKKKGLKMYVYILIAPLTNLIYYKRTVSWWIQPNSL